MKVCSSHITRFVSGLTSRSPHNPDSRASHGAWRKRGLWQLTTFPGGSWELVLDPPWWTYAALLGIGIMELLSRAARDGTRRIILTSGSESSLDSWTPEGMMRLSVTVLGDRYIDVHTCLFVSGGQPRDMPMYRVAFTRVVDNVNVLGRNCQ